MPRKKDLSKMSDDELMTAWTKVGDEAQALKEQLKEFSAEHDRRLNNATFEGIVLHAEGIDSEEGVGADD